MLAILGDDPWDDSVLLFYSAAQIWCVRKHPTQKVTRNLVSHERKSSALSSQYIFEKIMEKGNLECNTKCLSSVASFIYFFLRIFPNYCFPEVHCIWYYIMQAERACNIVVDHFKSSLRKKFLSHILDNWMVQSNDFYEDKWNYLFFKVAT